MKRTLVLLAACGGSKPAAITVAPPLDAAVAVVTPDAIPPPLDARDDDLPGHYAALVVHDEDGNHRGQWVSNDQRASIVLDLADDGAATMCFGEYSVSTIESDEFSRRSELRAQHGFRGTYAISSDTASVTLALDGTVCATVHESDYEDRTVTAVAMTCAREDVEAHPALVCKVAPPDSDFYELMIHELRSGKMVLGPGRGLSLRVEGVPQGGYFGGEDRVYTIAPSADAIVFDTWQR